jgi:XRE family transcriptional regulator, master regulator for biofilm formation
MQVSGLRVRRLREDAGLGLTQLADLASISKAYLSGLENGKKTDPSPQVVGRLAQALDVAIVDLRE